MQAQKYIAGAALAAGLSLAAHAAMATTLTTSRAAFTAAAGTLISTPNPGTFDLTQLFLPTTTTISLNGGVTLGLSKAAQVTQPQNGFPYLLSDGFTGELFIPQDASGNQVSSETISFGSSVSALGFEIAPFSSASGAPYIGFAGGPFSVSVTLAGGVTQTVTLPGGNDNTGTTTPQFFGYYGGGVTSLTIATSDPNGFGFGNFVDASTAVPEPASAALLLVGLAGLIARTRTRNAVA